MSYKSLISPLPILINFFHFKNKLNSKLFWSLIWLGIIVSLIISIYQFNIYTHEIYLIKQYEKRINQLNQENRLLEVELAKNHSLVNFNQYVQNFEKPNKIEYIHLLEGTALAK